LEDSTVKDNPLGPIAAVVALLGACALCALGPAFFLSITAAATGWFAGLNPMLSIGLGLVVAFALYRLWHAWGQRGHIHPDADGGEVS
jgi:hypothetical protein